jgi:hypothetical protein
VIVKGRARSNAGELAHHLLRVDTNERATVRHLRGVFADTLAGALEEMEALGHAARTRRPFYHASINSDPGHPALTTAQKVRAIALLEAKLGLAGQPRAVVEHVKHGRGHIHVVWSRIDQTRMVGIISDSHNYRRHMAVARQLECEFGHEPVQSAATRQEQKPRRGASHAEMMQAARSGIAPEATAARLTALWNASSTGQAFAAALEANGYVLARGDQRGFVAVDPAGEVHAINKKLTGLSASQVRDRLADVTLEHLPSVAQARAIQKRTAAPVRASKPASIDPARDQEALRNLLPLIAPSGSEKPYASAIPM